MYIYYTVQTVKSWLVGISSGKQLGSYLAAPGIVCLVFLPDIYVHHIYIISSAKREDDREVEDEEVSCLILVEDIGPHFDLRPLCD